MDVLLVTIFIILSNVYGDTNHNQDNKYPLLKNSSDGKSNRNNGHLPPFGKNKARSSHEWGRSDEDLMYPGHGQYSESQESRHPAEIKIGTFAYVHDHPYVVSLLARNDKVDNKAFYEDSVEFFCGGTIITSKAVLTAANCLVRILWKGVSTSDMLVRANTETWKCSCHRTRDHSVYGFQYHEDYNQRFGEQFRLFDNDIAVVFVLEQFNNVHEKAIPYKSLNAWNGLNSDQGIRALGWGKLAADFVRPAEHLRDVFIEVDMKNTWNCHYNSRKNAENQEERISKSTKHHGSHPMSKFCGQSNTSPYTKTVAQGLCTFDEGGPVIAPASNKYSIGLIGIVSSPLACFNHTSLFTNVSFYEEWIQMTLKDDSDPDNWW